MDPERPASDSESASPEHERRREDESRLLLAAAVEFSDDAIVGKNLDGTITTWNRGAERMFGYTAREAVGQPITLIVPPERLHEEERILAQLKGGERIEHFETVRRRKDGTPLDVSLVISPIKDSLGKVIGACKIARDITERRRTEEVLRLSEARFRVLAEKSPQMVWTCRSDGACDYLSPQWVDFTGVCAEEQLGSGWLQRVNPADREGLMTEWKRAVEKGTSLDQQFRIRRADGVYRWFKTQAVPLRDAEGRVVKWLGVSTDIDDEKRTQGSLETKVRERTAQLRASLDSVEELLYTIAHDLRAPNRHMRGFAQLLQQGYAGRLDELGRDYLDRINAAAAQNDDLIRDLLEYGRLSHQAVPLVPVDLQEAVEAVLHSVEGEIQERRAHVHLDRELPRVMANESMLKQILTNLVSNALLYVSPGREPEMVISAESDGGKAVLRVQDNGIGIPREQIERVFKPFIRLPNSTNAQGTGMGLAIVKKAAARLNGAVGVDSTPGKGSCFWLELRAA